VVHRIIEMNVKVASDDEFMRGGSSERPVTLSFAVLFVGN